MPSASTHSLLIGYRCSAYHSVHSVVFEATYRERRENRGVYHWIVVRWKKQCNKNEGRHAKSEWDGSARVRVRCEMSRALYPCRENHDKSADTSKRLTTDVIIRISSIRYGTPVIHHGSSFSFEFTCVSTRIDLRKINDRGKIWETISRMLGRNQKSSTDFWPVFKHTQ